MSLRNEDEVNFDDLKEDGLKKLLNNKKFSEIKHNLGLFNDSIVNHIVMWFDFSIYNNQDEELKNLKTKDLKAEIGRIFDDFFEQNLEVILNKVQF